MCVHIYLSASPGRDFLCCSLCPGPWDRFEWAPCLSSKSSLLCAGMRRQLQWIYINPAPHVCKFNCKHLVMSQGRGRRKTCGKEATHLRVGVVRPPQGRALEENHRIFSFGELDLWILILLSGGFAFWSLSHLCFEKGSISWLVTLVFSEACQTICSLIVY